ncbi:MAG TPA: penicillin-binding protein [Flavobacteriaceae bacterium]|nr:penicillin-binding protein [Flavobacteriaceae bacterium]
MITEKNISNRFYFIAGGMLLFALGIGFQLFKIQFVEGDEFRELAQERVFKNFTIEANRGNLYGSNGAILATSVPQYDIRFDAVTVSNENFEKFVVPLSKALSKMFGKSVSHYEVRLREARKNKNRYLFIAGNLGYSQYIKVKNFPMFNLGPYQGGFISEQSTVREHPLGKVAERTVGYAPAVGLEGAFNDYLEGINGHRLKQKISNGIWKPISDENEMDPQDGLDVVTTIDVNIQDIAHHALLEQLQKFEADHGTVVVMEVKTGAIKAIVNLGKSEKTGNYFEKRNYAVYEAAEPGSTFKLMALVAALEDKVVDTSTVIDTEDGSVRYFDRTVWDSHHGGYGKISVAKAFEVSSNTAFSKIVYDNYKNNPEMFINRLNNMGLNKKIGLEIRGEGKPEIPYPGDANWYGTTLPWMSFGYGVELTPLQTLVFYNAIANNGVKIKPRFIKEVRNRNKLIKSFEEPIIMGSVCSKETALMAREMMENVVKRGTAQSLFSEEFSMAGKTGTCQVEYWIEGGRYISSFAGYFPAENPKYSCIVIVHKPNPAIGFYGGTVAAPVFKKIVQKIYSDTPKIEIFHSLQIEDPKVEKSFQAFYDIAKKYENSMPDVTGLPAMDAISLLENMGLEVEVNGIGVITEQSVPEGTRIKKNQKINLKVG